jgi:SAM-dependent methyltransferase
MPCHRHAIEGRSIRRTSSRALLARGRNRIIGGVRCGTALARRADPLGISFDRIADRYDATRGYPEWVMEDILAALGRTLSKDSLILDSGVGTGRFAQPLQARGYRVVGVDISSRMLGKAREKGTEGLVKADVCVLPFRDGVFESAMSVHVMHLISTWRCALAEIGRVTTRDFMSVAFNKEESPAEQFRRFYDQACADLGFDVRHPGVHERELPDVLPVDEARLITLHEHPVDVQKLLDDYEARTYSSQWEVPEEIHEEAIAVLRERYEGVVEVEGRESISLLIWDLARVREFVSGAGRA